MNNFTPSRPNFQPTGNGTLDAWMLTCSYPVVLSFASGCNCELLYLARAGLPWPTYHRALRETTGRPQ